MSEEEADQFLSLIAENAQLKAEIMSLRKYDKAIRMLDRSILRVFTREVIGSEKPQPNMRTLISEVRIGVTPVESAESFKERMKGERIRKLCEVQRGKIADLEEKIEKAGEREAELKKAIEELEKKIEEHKKVIEEAQTIKENFGKQIDLMTAAIEKATAERDELTNQVTKEQATGLELRRNIEQSKRNVSLLRSQQSQA